VLQEAGPLLPCVPSPLLLDTVGYDPFTLCRILDPLTRRYPQPFTLALVRPTDDATHQLLGLCPAVALVVTETLTLRVFRHFLTALGTIHPHDLVPAGAFWFGMGRPPQRLHDPDVLRLLPALAQAPQMQAVPPRVAMSRTTVMRKCRALRAALGLESATRLPPGVLAAQVIAALEVPPAPPDCAGDDLDADVRVAGQSR
jgi:hypothetical protein